jgi:hypothetical protein
MAQRFLLVAFGQSFGGMSGQGSQPKPTARL